MPYNGNDDTHISEFRYRKIFQAFLDDGVNDDISLLRNKSFLLKFLSQQNASKFAIFLS